MPNVGMFAHCIVQGVFPDNCENAIQKLYKAYKDIHTTPYPKDSTYYIDDKSLVKSDHFAGTRTYISNLTSEQTGKVIDPPDRIHFWVDTDQKDHNGENLDDSNSCKINAMSIFSRKFP